jgi:tetratricopeptide (TPR) repeat protein
MQVYLSYSRTKKEGTVLDSDGAKLKPSVLALLRLAWEQEQAMIDGLSRKERDIQGTPDEWSPKDIVAHVAYWKELQTGKLTMAVQGETPPVWNDMDVVDALDTRSYLEFSHRTWQEVVIYLQSACTGLLARVESLSEEELTEPNRYPWQDAEGEPLWDETLGNGLWHPFTHLKEFYQARGDTESAVRIYATLAQALREMPMPPDVLGYALYNMAGIHARAGQTDEALRILPEAIKHHPALAGKLKRDGSFDRMRNEPAIQALTGP